MHRQALPAAIFVLIKMIAEIIQEAITYSKRRKQAIFEHRRRPEPPDFSGLPEETART